MNQADLIKDGFVEMEDGDWQKEVNGRLIRCFRNPKYDGYWVVYIEPICKPACNDRIVTIEHLNHFVEQTCNSQIDFVNVKLAK